MDNFEKILREKLAEQDAAQVAQEFTNSLNKILKENNEQTAKTACLNRITKAKQSVKQALNDANPSPKAIGEMAILTYEKHHPEWTVEDLNLLSRTVNDSAETATELVGKDFKTAIKETIDGMTRSDNSIIETFFDTHGWL